MLTTAKNIVGAINELFSVKANKAHSHGNSEITDIDASKIKTGTIDISRLPQAALERCVVVADDTARFRLTKSQVQVGDSVKVTSPDNLMYIVVDDNKLNVEAGYVAYSAAVKWGTIKDKPSTFPPSAHTQDWSTITGKPSSFTPSSHTHTKNQITDFPSSLKNPTSLTIQANGATLGSYDGSAAKTFNITASNVGASPSNHNHDSTYSKTSHSHTAGQVGAYTKGEIDTKFKNYCPVSVGSIDIRYDNKNPAEVYPSTTWELLSSDKYIRTGTTPLNTGGSNSVTINKANLPNVKLKVDSFSLTTQPHTHNLHVMGCTNQGANIHQNAVHTDNEYHGQVDLRTDWNYAKSGGGANTGSASPSTESLGSGTALSIQPSYITLKFWKRLT